MNDAEVKLQVKLDDTKASKSIDKLSNKTEKLSKSFTRAGKVLTAGLTLPLAGLGAIALKGAMELEATEAKYNTVFKGMTDTVDNFIKEFQKLTPATTSEARSMFSGIQDLLVPMGFLREEATELTGRTMHLVGALTNFNSATHTAEDVSIAFSAAITGEMQSLKRLGIQVNMETLNQKALQMSGKATTDELTAQDKAVALLELSYEQSTDALKAYNKESLDTKTKLGLANAEFQNQLAILGEHLLPLVEKGISLFQKLNGWLGELSPTGQKLILVVGGFLATLGPILLAVSGLITILPILAGVFGALTVPIALIALGIIALVALFIYLWTTSEDFRDVITSVFKFVWQNALKPFFENVKHIFDGVMDVIKGAFRVIRGILKGDLGLVISGVGTMFKGLLNIVTGVLNKLISNINAMISLILLPINALIAGINLIPGLKIPYLRVAIPKIPKLDTGTNYVQREGLAYIDKGEAVVPKKYNPALGGGMGQVIQLIMPDIYMDNDKVGRAVTPIVSKTLRLGGAY